MNITDYNKNVWDRYVTNKVCWTIPVSKDDIENAKNGIWNIVLTPTKPVPHNWFPDLNELKILGLASGGGQQGPIFTKMIGTAKKRLINISLRSLQPEP